MNGVAPVRWGFLSTARINRRLLDAAEKTDRAEIVAVASRDRDRAEAYASEHGIERAHGRYESLLEDPDVEAVYISLPNSLHVEWSVRALAAGKHVLCEKPLTRHPEEADEAFDAAERAGRVLMEAFMWRHSPQTAKLMQLVQGGVIGELQLVRATFSFPVEGRRNIRLDPGLDGGALMDVGTYCVSAARLLGGEPERVYGEQVIGDSGVDLLFSGVMRFPRGVLALIDAGMELPRRDGLEAVGTEGSLVIPDPWLARRLVLHLGRGDAREEIALPPADPYRLELENMWEAIRGEGEPLLGREDAVGQARTLDALYRSADAGRPVEL
ncbi:MAG TPA: Gfo/Idh/MocA family oxidoreductase [Gaiellaceae bacterium]|jgi:xylose dehydrogenase (NAD/NADP)|nr:Gfo/Idh/MocA family oxidoreductase [Gaiellaceae bacterium]